MQGKSSRPSTQTLLDLKAQGVTSEGIAERYGVTRSAVQQWYLKMGEKPAKRVKMSV